MDTTNDPTAVLIKREKYEMDSEEDEIPLAQMKKDLANSNDGNKCPTNNSLELPVRIKTEPIDSVGAPMEVEHTPIGASSTIASDPLRIDDFVIYELDEVNSQISAPPTILNKTLTINRGIVTGCVGPQPKRFKVTSSNISQRTFRLDRPSKITVTPSGQPISVTPIIRENTSPVIQVVAPATKPLPPTIRIITSATNASASSAKEVILQEVKPSSTKKLPVRKLPPGPVRPTLPRVKAIMSSKGEMAPIKLNPKLSKKMTEIKSNCSCQLSHIPKKGTDVNAKLELKDFFEQMFEETRKLSIERRQIVKMALLKAVCQAEEDVEAGKYCERCYTGLVERASN